MNELNILCCPDNNYTPYCGIMLTSLFENNKSVIFTVYLVTTNLTKKNKELLAQLCNNYHNLIRIIEIDDINLDNCPIREGDHISIAAYYRIIAPLLLPFEIDRILYFDGDIIINGSIADLYNTNIKEHALGAIIDEDYLNCQKYHRLDRPVNNGYINSGVLLLNLKYWRKHHLVDKCLAYIRDNQEKLKQHDQDVLNAVLYDKIKLLPLRYNFQTGFIYKNSVLEDQIINKVQECMYTPIVIHYTGPNKPWYKNCKHPYKKRFLHYKSISLWKDIPMQRKQSIKDVVINIIHEFIWRVGIKKRPQTYIIEEQV